MQRKIVNTLGTAVVFAATGLSFGCSNEDAGPEPESADFREHVDPVFYPDNPTCADILGPGYEELKVEPVADGSYSDGTLTVTIDVRNTADGPVFDWDSNLGIDGVFVKGGPNGNFYLYDPEEDEDTGLHAPMNPDNDMYYGLSHISFCYDLNLEVSKTAETSFTRAWDWEIEKTSEFSELLLSLDQVIDIMYQVMVDTTGFTDSDWAVTGQITIFNPSTQSATITSIVDMVDGVQADVTCPGGGFPRNLAGGATLVCTYEAELSDGSDRTNVVTVSTTGPVEGGSATAPVDFGAPTTKIDECIEVTDTLGGDLGEVCVGSDPLPYTFTYTYTYTATECGHDTIDNTATFTTNDTGTTGNDSVTIPVEVPCDVGCTLTPGYWKTHSEYGPAPYDNTWAMLPDGADTPFFNTGVSYLQALSTPPAGNQCQNMVRALAATLLNILNGADASDIQAVVDAAIDLLEANPDFLSTCPKALRKTALQYAEQLDRYNNGLTGPGHCDE